MPFVEPFDLKIGQGSSRLDAYALWYARKEFVLDPEVAGGTAVPAVGSPGRVRVVHFLVVDVTARRVLLSRPG